MMKIGKFPIRTGEHKRALVLNQDYTPLTTMSWQRSIRLSIIGQEAPEQGVRVLEYYQDDFVKSANGELFPVPAVVVMNKFVTHNKIKIPISKKNIYLRDNYQCQYCGCKLDQYNSSVDHIVPRSFFRLSNVEAANTWENLVACCLVCNRIKGDKPLHMTKMSLIKKPKKLDHVLFLKHIYSREDVPHEWRTYLG